MNKQELILAISQIADEITRQAQKLKLVSRDIRFREQAQAASLKLRQAEIELRLLQEKVRDESE